MFYSLPVEIQLDVLKCLNFNQLFSFRQTNTYLRNLINKYENGLARMEFSLLEIDTYDLIACQKNGFKIIVPESSVSEFILNDQLLEKWEEAIFESIPLYLHSISYNVGAKFSIYLKPNLLLKLPNIPKNIEEMLVIRFWLEQLFKCAFGEGRFIYNIFNPQMINLLFDNDKTISQQFNIQEPHVSLTNNLFDDSLKFTLNHLANSTNLTLNLYYVDYLKDYTDILFNILINEGNKFPKISFDRNGLEWIFDLIIEYIATSKDCSKMVSVISLKCNNYPNSKLKKLAKNVEIYNGSSLIDYQITNIYNPKVKFGFSYSCSKVTIERM
ncbi:unnamed protein product [Meloidogyne enterolobii]|uniref:Uncharacterized protein n=1 Tax=Meloidogyne enterolobii TaxID=390850 RepID=A0ACB0YWZ0_MELEN